MKMDCYRIVFCEIFVKRGWEAIQFRAYGRIFSLFSALLHVPYLTQINKWGEVLYERLVKQDIIISTVGRFFRIVRNFGDVTFFVVDDFVSP